MSHTVNAPTASPAPPAILLPSYQAFKESIERDVLRFEKEIHTKISELTHARTLLKKAGASEDAIALIQAEVTAARHHKTQKWSYARHKVENHVIKMVSKLRKNVLEPHTRTLRGTLRSKKTKPVFTEACARLPHQKEILLQAIAILKRYKKGTILSTAQKPSVPHTENQETFETYMQERHRQLTHFAKTVSKLTALFQAWTDVSVSTLSASNQEPHINKKPSLPEPHKAARDCIDTGHHMIIRGLHKMLVSGTPESALSYFSYSLRHLELAQAFLLEHPSTRALSLALDMKVSCSNSLTSTTWKVVEKIQHAVDIAATSTPSVTKRKPAA